MSEAKAEMYGSYLALFYFACAMFLLQLFFESKVGPVVWGLVAWQIYRRNKATLIYTLTSLFWLIIVGGIIGIVWVVLDSLNLKLQQFVAAEGIAAAVSAGLLWWMRAFFEKSPLAADIFSASIARAQALASAGVATVERPLPDRQAGNIHTRVVASPAPEPQRGIILTRVAESPAPEPPAEDIPARVAENPASEPSAGNALTRAFARVKQVIPWRRRLALPAAVDNPPATAGDVAASGGVTHPVTHAYSGTDFDRSKVLQTATINAVRIDDQPAPPPLAVPKQVAPSPDIKAEPSGFPKTVLPESRSTVPPLTVVDEERVYAEIANELETGGMDKGLWTRLFAECDGDERRTKVIYIRQRAERLISAERARRSQ